MRLAKLEAGLAAGKTGMAPKGPPRFDVAGHLKLQVGDDWNYSFQRQLAGGPIKMSWIGHGEALSIERVDLPNGQTVDALKIEFFERPSVARYRFEMHVYCGGVLWVYCGDMTSIA